jgi:hypothetical protein
VVAWALVLLAVPGLAAQEPPDTLLPADSVPADSVVLDSLAVDSLQAAGDSAAVDSIFYNLPAVEGGAPAGWRRGIWVWDHEALMASGANTLVELVARLPGMVPIRGGDYGTPLGLSALGAAGGAVRVIRDGVEVTPLAAGVPDLQRVGLGGIEEVRLERRLGEMVIHLTSLRHDDARPYSLVEAGTGDLDTNIFRGAFTNPTALGGSVALSLERVDTRGPAGEEPGTRNGVWARYQLHRGDRAGLAVDFRRMSSETDVPDYAATTTRTDWGVRGSALLARGLTAEAYWATSSHRVEDPRDRYAAEGGSRSQVGTRLGFNRGPVWLRGAYRRFGGDPLPGDRLELEGGADLAGLGGVAAGWERTGWDARATRLTHVQAWTGSLLGFSLFGSWLSGERGARTGPLREVVPPDTVEAAAAPLALQEVPGEPGADSLPSFRTVDRTVSRVGARWGWRGVALSGALLEVEADSLLPTGLEFDREEPALPGGTRSGWELWGRLPVPLLEGLRLEGSLQQWDEGWPYLPERVYRASFAYHRTFLETGNLELDWRLGVRGRDPMAVRRIGEPEVDPDTGEPVARLASVPFFQSWYGTIQVRVVTVRVFIGWENFAVRRNLQDVPGRVLPITRAFYGIRWTLHN